MSQSIINNMNHILDENQKDLKKGEKLGISDALTDRLTLTRERIESMSSGLIKIIQLEDPV